MATMDEAGTTIGNSKMMSQETKIGVKIITISRSQEKCLDHRRTREQRRGQKSTRRAVPRQPQRAAVWRQCQ
eukprot:6799895-Pyramimonas_sp.AAC.1